MMGEAGYQKVKSEFTSESQTKKLELIYNEVLNSKLKILIYVKSK